MADPVWIVDGDNLAHLRGQTDDYQRAREQLVADTAGWAARSGVRAVVVLDGHGADRTIAATAVLHSRNETADTVIERLAYRHAGLGDEVTVVSNDTVVRHVAQRGGVHAMSAREFIDRLAGGGDAPPPPPSAHGRYQLGDALDPAVRAALERLRRGGG